MLRAGAVSIAVSIDCSIAGSIDGGADVADVERKEDGGEDAELLDKRHAWAARVEADLKDDLQQEGDGRVEAADGGEARGAKRSRGGNAAGALCLADNAHQLEDDVEDDVAR